MADALDKTARQVRSTRADGHHSSAVHKLTEATTVDMLGRRYNTRCGRYFYADEGAILTTHDVDCSECLGTSMLKRVSVARRELEAAGVLVGAAP